ncbi:MAG: nuclear transport factor 2 family protein [Marinibacterium sp.]
METGEVIHTAVDAYQRKDLDAALACCADGVAFRLMSDSGMDHAYRFHCRGTGEFRAALQEINGDFDIQTYDLIELFVHGNRAASRTAITLFHRVSGQRIETELANFWTVEDGKITSIQEFSDTAALTASRVAAAG